MSEQRSITEKVETLFRLQNDFGINSFECVKEAKQAKADETAEHFISGALVYMNQEHPLTFETQQKMAILSSLAPTLDWDNKTNERRPLEETEHLIEPYNNIWNNLVDICAGPVGEPTQNQINNLRRNLERAQRSIDYKSGIYQAAMIQKFD
jgi:hypothetical protein